MFEGSDCEDHKDMNKLVDKYKVLKNSIPEEDKNNNNIFQC